MTIGLPGMTLSFGTPTTQYSPPPTSTYTAPRTISGRYCLNSHHNTRLSCESNGRLVGSGNKGGWETWNVADCGNGRVTLSAHIGQQLSCDSSGRLGVSTNRGAWEQFAISPCGNGKYFLQAHTGNHLGLDDRGELYCKNRNTGGWEQWDLLSI